MTKLKRICITTVYDHRYSMGGYNLFNTINRYTNCAGIDFKVITSDPEVLKEVGPENCHFVNDEIRSRYSGVKYSQDLPKEKYETSWYRYEIFNFKDYDRVICIDSDCICIGDISYLFGEDLDQYDLVSVEDHIVTKCFTKLVPQLEAQGLRFDGLRKRISEGKIDIQPALLVVNRSLLDSDFYSRLIKYVNEAPFSYSVDQGMLNNFIYQEGLKIHLLPLEYDYQDLYEIHCPMLPVPANPVIVHCQDSKPFIKYRYYVDPRMHKWYDRWWDEYSRSKTIVVVIVWNRFNNLMRWVNCWNQCNHSGSRLVVIHNLESDNERYQQLCLNNHIKYIPRQNLGFDIGAFQDVCRERLPGFPNDWDRLIWISDDCIPMARNFVQHFLDRLVGNEMPCYEISNEYRRHVRTTGFMVTKEISKRLIFPEDPMRTREACYQFEHRGFTLYDQLTGMGINPVMVIPDLASSPLWDTGCRAWLNLSNNHAAAFA